MKEIGAKLAPKVDKVGVATQTLANLNGQTVLLVYRNAPGEAEFHEGAADFTIIHAGEGTMVLGGTVKDGRTTGPGEIRGASIEGGQSYPVTAGDVINVPAKTPHHTQFPARRCLPFPSSRTSRTFSARTAGVKGFCKNATSFCNRPVAVTAWSVYPDM